MKYITAYFHYFFLSLPVINDMEASKLTIGMKNPSLTCYPQKTWMQWESRTQRKKYPRRKTWNFFTIFFCQNCNKISISLWKISIL